MAAEPEVCRAGGGAGQADSSEDEDSLQGQAEVLNRIEHVVAVMSGKGGVGKSSVAAMLAVALRRSGKRVGLLDADITGPSIPHMFGLHQQPGMSPLGIVPPETAGGDAEQRRPAAGRRRPAWRSNPGQTPGARREEPACRPSGAHLPPVKGRRARRPAWGTRAHRPAWGTPARTRPPARPQARRPGWAWGRRARGRRAERPGLGRPGRAPG